MDLTPDLEGLRRDLASCAAAGGPEVARAGDRAEGGQGGPEYVHPGSMDGQQDSCGGWGDVDMATPDGRRAGPPVPVGSSACQPSPR